MKMHHLDKEKVEAIMLKVKQVVDSGKYPADVIEEIFKLSQVDGEKFLVLITFLSMTFPTTTEHGELWCKRFNNQTVNQILCDQTILTIR